MIYTNIIEKAMKESTLLKPVNTSMELLAQENGVCARVSKTEKLAQDDANTFVNVPGIDFHNGTISVEVCGRLLSDAPAHARGFIGLVFRANADTSEFESFYIRPANGRSCTDPIRRAHGCQYFSFPGYTFSYFREFGIDGFEAPVDDIALGQWTNIRAEIHGKRADFFVNDCRVLTVEDLKHGGAARGSVGLYVDIGTDGFFRNLSIVCED